MVIDDVCVPELFAEHYKTLFAAPYVYPILLVPSVEALTERITERGGPYVEFFVDQAIPYVATLIEAMPKEGWTVLDTSEWTIEQTADEVLNSLA